MKNWLLILFLLLPINVFAGNGSQQLFGEWNTVVVNGKFAKDSPWIYSVEFSERNSQEKDGNGFDFTQFVNYSGVGYRFTPNHQILTGFWYQYTQPPYSGKIVQELNAWQQYDFNDTYSFGKIMTRTRLEERNNISQANANGPSVRFRQRLKYEYPFTKEWSGIASEEIFFNLNSVNWGPTQGFDQNRVFVGAGYKFNDIVKTEFGYMNQYVNRNLKADFIDHQLSLNLFVNVPD